MKTQTLKKILAPWLNLPFPVYILFLARIINRLGDFVNFFLALYLTEFLGFDEGETGFIVSLVGLSMMGGAILGGKLTDALGRKRVLLFLQSLQAATIILCGFMPDSRSIAFLILLFVFFNGAARPVNTALLTDLTTQDKRQAAFSLLYLGINIGVAVGPLLAGFLFHTHREWLFWGDGLTTLATVALIALFVREPEPHADVKAPGRRGGGGSTLQALRETPAVAWFIPFSVLSAFIYSQHAFTLPLQISDLLGRAGARTYGFVMSINAVAVLIITPPLSRFLKIRPLKQIVLAQLFYGLGFGLLIIPLASPLWFYLTTLFWTTGEVLDAINGSVFIANNSPASHRGRFNSLFVTTKGAGRALAPLAAGFVISRSGAACMWGLVTVLSLISWFGMGILERRFRSGGEISTAA